MFGKKEKPRQMEKPSCPHLPRAEPETTYSSNPKNGEVASSATVLRTIENKECEECQRERKDARTYRTKIMAGLLLPFTLQAFDVTIIASALPWIAVAFDQIDQLNWVVASFNLTSSAFIPCWGQLADIFGRYWSLQASVLFVLVGSVLCTAAPTAAFPVLLLGRAFQGIGSAGIGVIVEVIIADRVSLKENAKNNSIFSFIGGSSYAVGPVLGGALTKASWRWCFGINLPICIISFVILFFIRSVLLGPKSERPEPASHDHLASEPRGEGEPHGTLSHPRRIHTLESIDIGGQVLSFLGFGLMILSFTWAGASYDWDAPAVLVPLVLGVGCGVGFVVWEYLMAPGRVLARRYPKQNAMLPWDLMKQRNIGLLFYVNFGTGMGMFAVLYFASLYFTMVKGHDASSAGVQLLLYVPGIGGGVIAAMYMCNVWPKRTWWPIFLGSSIETIGLGLLAYALHTESYGFIYGMMAMCGVGTGIRFMPGTIHAIGFFPAHISTIVAFMGVAFPFGGTLGLTIMTTVFNNTSNISRDSPYRDFSSLGDLPEDILRVVRHDAKTGIVWAFVAVLPFMVLSVIAAAALGNVRITTDDIHSGDDAYKQNLTEGSYIGHMLSRKRRRTGS